MNCYHSPLCGHWMPIVFIDMTFIGMVFLSGPSRFACCRTPLVVPQRNGDYWWLSELPLSHLWATQMGLHCCKGRRNLTTGLLGNHTHRYYHIKPLLASPTFLLCLQAASGIQENTQNCSTLPAHTRTMYNAVYVVWIWPPTVISSYLIQSNA